MTNEACHFSIGVVDVTVRSDCRSVLDDYLSLYGSYRCPFAKDGAIEVEVYARHRYPWQRGPYVIRSRYGDSFQVRRRNEVLPHLEWMINWQVIQRCQAYAQLHAATVEIDGQGLILPGEPGSGKSTLTAGLLASGWSYLCDEFALIDPGTLRVAPFPRALCIKEPSFPVIERLGLPLLRRTPYQKAAKGRVAFLNPLDVRQDAAGRKSHVRWVIFPLYVAGATPALEAITRSQAAYDLARQCFNFPMFQGRAVSVLAKMVRDVECYRLTSGDIESTCNLLESHLLRRELRKAS